jgi:hypothetical protein
MSARQLRPSAEEQPSSSRVGGGGRTLRRHLSLALKVRAVTSLRRESRGPWGGFSLKRSVSMESESERRLARVLGGDGEIFYPLYLFSHFLRTTIAAAAGMSR